MRLAYAMPNWMEGKSPGSAEASFGLKRLVLRKSVYFSGFLSRLPEIAPARAPGESSPQCSIFLVGKCAAMDEGYWLRVSARRWAHGAYI